MFDKQWINCGRKWIINKRKYQCISRKKISLFIYFFFFIYFFWFSYFNFYFDRTWPTGKPAKARYHKVPTRHTRHEFPMQRSSLWWRRFIGALTLTGQSFCSVPCLSCASGSQLCGGILWVGSLLPVRRVVPATSGTSSGPAKKELQQRVVFQQHAALIGGPNATSCPVCHKLFLGGEALMEHMKHTHKDPNASGVASKYWKIAYRTALSAGRLCLSLLRACCFRVLTSLPSHTY